MYQVTWLKENRFYTYSVLGGDDQQMIFAQLGANDPNFNLRSESLLIHRVESAKDHTFVSVLETHGEYNGTSEYTNNATSSLVSLRGSTFDEIDIVTVELVGGVSYSLALAYDGDQHTPHKITHNGRTLEWIGHHALINNKE
jgi:hypothetical protein